MLVQCCSAGYSSYRLRQGTSLTHSQGTVPNSLSPQLNNAPFIYLASLHPRHLQFCWVCSDAWCRPQLCTTGKFSKQVRVPKPAFCLSTVQYSIAVQHTVAKWTLRSYYPPNAVKILLWHFVCSTISKVNSVSYLRFSSRWAIPCTFYLLIPNNPQTVSLLTLTVKNILTGCLLCCLIHLYWESGLKTEFSMWHLQAVGSFEALTTPGSSWHTNWSWFPIFHVLNTSEILPEGADFSQKF